MMRLSAMRVRKPLTGRLLLLAGVLGVVVACANVSEPPGGPPDVQPPVVLRLSPDSGAVVPRPREVLLQFDEVISETPRGAPDLASLVFISPKSGVPEVDWGRTRLTIRPSKGWKPNTVYSITIGAGITDLRNNGIDSAIRLVFSTGGAIPDTRLDGVAFEWVQGRGAARALVEAIAPDSTTYQTLSDSAGRYELRALPPGPYVVRAVLDRNANRELDPLEPWDTLSVMVDARATADLYAFQRDTVGLRISDIAVQDSGRTLRITFDKPFSPYQAMLPERVTVKRADSTTVNVLRVITPSQRAIDDSLRAKYRADSVARASADTSTVARARADSLVRLRRADSVAAVARAEREARRLLALRGGRVTPRDTTPPPKFNRPPAAVEIYVTLADTLASGARYRVQVNGIRSLSGTARSPSRELLMPKRDTTRAPTPPRRP